MTNQATAYSLLEKIVLSVQLKDEALCETAGEDQSFQDIALL